MENIIHCKEAGIVILKGRIRCANGVSLSIQASAIHDCTPRNNVGPWTHMAVGAISDATGARVTPPESWREFAEGPFPSYAYANVPVELIEAFLAENNTGFIAAA